MPLVSAHKLMSDTEDPLNIGHCVTSETKTIPVQEPVVVIKRSESGPVHLLEVVDQQSVRRPSLLELSKLVQEQFISEMPEQDQYVMSSTSLTLMPDLAQSEGGITNNERREFEKCLRYAAGGETAESRKQRRTQFREAINKVREMAGQRKQAQTRCTERRCELMKQSRGVVDRLEELRRMGAVNQRKEAAKMMIYFRKKKRIEKLKSEMEKRNIERAMNFIDFLVGMEGKVRVLPIVDVVAFEQSFDQPSARIKKLEEQCSRLEKNWKELVEEKPGTGDWFFNILHPLSKKGKIIKRFEERVDRLSYEDVYTIIQHLSDDRSEVAKVEQLLFDLAWQKKDYPFGLVQETPLPSKGDLFPAVVGDTVVDRQYAFIPFSTLNGMDWPFKPAVDKIFEMMILTNPFDIARVFYDVIHQAAECMESVLVAGGMDPDDVEIDFDSLFPILMICVFVFGVDEWMKVALYTLSFNEQAANDPQLQFAMTYLEGLMTHIMALDTNKLREKAVQMQKQLSEEQKEPKGGQ